ncbi:hypothetical protein HN371_27745 [Candidatus Poribacteria bacterium]|jgi:hypothetical protein|nr:hypothetical protein [Candidatus Poribacteria bacterium]MBT5535081.1 hypothetical protein [Candidatus Poribacteria bacterium]MBT5712394.1 hypothetical protein [Candidatus Poribacteria bacterium]MBT7095772.1 hypothetical protein [Candidatus Poribacteria bacterium]MBT7807461.1 hypothetical protein [Candidatus Poribacteria bacterium]
MSHIGNGLAIARAACASVSSGGQEITFATDGPAPSGFDRWTFYWTMPRLADGAEIASYVVLEPDGSEHFTYGAIGHDPGTSIRSDFMPGFAGGDPSVFYGKPIRIVFRASTGEMRFDPGTKFRFEFEQTVGGGADVSDDDLFWEPETQADVTLCATSDPRFEAVDLSGACTRPHGDTQIGGDGASFATWFSTTQVEHGGVPFVVGLEGDDILASPSDGANTFRLNGLGRPAKALHLLLMGFNNPRRPADLLLRYGDGSTDAVSVPLHEWTRAQGDVAFAFENTRPDHPHAAVNYERVAVPSPVKVIEAVESRGSQFVLVAMTLEA